MMIIRERHVVILNMAQMRGWRIHQSISGYIDATWRSVRRRKWWCIGFPWTGWKFRVNHVACISAWMRFCPLVRTCNTLLYTFYVMINDIATNDGSILTYIIKSNVTLYLKWPLEKNTLPINLYWDVEELHVYMSQSHTQPRNKHSESFAKALQIPPARTNANLQPIFSCGFWITTRVNRDIGRTWSATLYSEVATKFHPESISKKSPENKFWE